MAQLFFDPRGAAVTIGSVNAGQASAASIKVNRTTAKYMEWDDTACQQLESEPILIAQNGDLTLSMLGAADLNLLAIALSAGSGMTIGAGDIEEYAITIVVKNVANACATRTYSFPRCQLADGQEHVFASKADATDPVELAIAFRVLPAAGSRTLGTVT